MTRLFLILLLLIVSLDSARTMRSNDANCRSNKLKELILETIGMYPHQYSYQAKYLKQEAESRFGNWWSAVIVSDRGGYGMSAIYDEYRNTSCEMNLFDTYYWVGRTC
ncbi:hypothetical protein PRIPAC_90128 [Pristionchus pacificus]|uniref:Uncharacterized protein n=1 Tax=Pristionchus pacificus TaxID=54126 RepID=A0A2A6CZB3_PRIPA|nr:hypothetical protein PRIPAC_90128 [Pristionchus pacificus]|eukprot:PDM83468.1 hypothetical protein PRIPAC_35100 [Pristionchus pacificus]